MKLLVKFNLLLIAVFGLGLGFVALEANHFLQREAQADVLRQAALLTASARATRAYTEDDVSPLLQKTAAHEQTFLPQTIPFFAATATFEKVHGEYPDYTYKEAALNPTNLRDRASDWEADIIHHFQGSPGEKELTLVRDTAVGRSLYLAHPSAWKADACSATAAQV